MLRNVRGAALAAAVQADHVGRLRIRLVDAEVLGHGGQLFDLGAHLLDLRRHLLGTSRNLLDSLGLSLANFGDFANRVANGVGLRTHLFGSCRVLLDALASGHPQPLRWRL